MSRSSLLRKASLLSRSPDEAVPQSMITISDTCIESGRAMGCLLNKLETINKFNPFTWWDVFYTVTSTLILMLDINCHIKQRTLSPAAESPIILAELTTLMAKHLDHPRVPGSMKTWARIVLDVSQMADQMITSYRSQRVLTSSLEAQSHTSVHTSRESQSPTTKRRSRETPVPSTISRSTEYTNAQAAQNQLFNYENLVSSRGNTQQFWSQMSFMDDQNGQAHDWSWDDIDAVLRGSSTQQNAIDQK
jgi:hypothetical protein